MFKTVETDSLRQRDQRDRDRHRQRDKGGEKERQTKMTVPCDVSLTLMPLCEVATWHDASHLAVLPAPERGGLGEVEEVAVAEALDEDEWGCKETTDVSHYNQGLSLLADFFKESDLNFPREN